MDFRDIGIGAGQGVDKGLNTLGAVQGLWNRQKEQEHLDRTQPIQEKMLENQGFIQQLNVDKAKAEEARLNTPLDIMTHPEVRKIYESAAPEDKLVMESRIKAVPQNYRGLSQLQQNLATDEELAGLVIKSGGRAFASKLTQAAGAVKQKQDAFMALPDTDQNKAKLKAELDTDIVNLKTMQNEAEAFTGNADKAMKDVQINNLIISNPILFKDKQGQAAVQYARELRDPEVLKKVIDAKTANPTMWTSLLEKNNGDIGKALEDLTNARKEVKAAPGTPSRATTDKPLPPSYVKAMESELDKRYLSDLPGLNDKIRRARITNPKASVFSVLEPYQQQAYLSVVKSAAGHTQKGRAKTPQQAIDNGLNDFQSTNRQTKDPNSIKNEIAAKLSAGGKTVYKEDVDEEYNRLYGGK